MSCVKFLKKKNKSFSRSSRADGQRRGYWIPTGTGNRQVMLAILDVGFRRFKFVFLLIVPKVIFLVSLVLENIQQDGRLLKTIGDGIFAS